MGQEIERKFLVSNELAAEYLKRAENGEFEIKLIEQAYLTTDPVVRVRRSNDKFILTYKGSGLMSREEYNLPLNEDSYNILKSKADGNVICKKRINIPYDKYLIELDVFMEPFAPLVLAEVEFDSEKDANDFLPPDWFLEDVTNDRKYHNSNMSRMTVKTED